MSDSRDKSNGGSVEAVFQEALSFEGAERVSYLARVCPDSATRGRVEALLAAHGDESGFLPVGDSIETVASEAPTAEETGAIIGRYKLLEKLGEGGFGSVWAAEQREPVKRRVALKIIKLGMDTKQVVARFEAERQALALMDHPNIAKVLDAGTTGTGRPYFVMELVKGIPITKFFEQERTQVTAKLKLFIRVCQAIQHAHQKGIIHRDIKPSNVMVTLHDGEPVPKVIDFGIAKATQGELTDKTIYTQYSQFIGTPAYMSPEQAEMSGLDVDTRSDIYSLGVLLYEILTGSTPFDSKELMASGIDEMRKIIRERDPVKPITRLSQTLEDASPQSGRVKELRLSRELDWIVLRCLEKDRSRRYETAIGLAKDIQRHLDNEPVLACSPTTWYRMQKALRRNRIAWSAPLAVAASLVLGLAASLWLAHVARLQKNDAEEAKATAEEERTESDQARVAADTAKEELRLRSYVAEINVAAQLIEAGNLKPALKLLDRQIPQGDETDIRGIEWDFLIAQSQDRSIATFSDQGARAVAFSPDSRLLAYSDRKTVIRDVASRSVVTTLAHDAISLGFSPTENVFVSASLEQVIVWNSGVWREEMILPDAQSPVLFSPDGRRLITGREGGYQVWDTDSWQPLSQVEADREDGRGLGLGFSERGDFLVVPTRDAPRFSLFRFPELVLLPAFESDEARWLRSSCFLKRDAGLLTGSGLGTLLKWDVEAGKAIGSYEGAHRGFIQRIVSSPDGNGFLTASSDRTLKIWQTETMELSALLRGHTGELECAAWSPDGSLIATGAFDGTTRLWDAETRVDPREFALKDQRVADYHQLDFRVARNEPWFASGPLEREEIELFELTDSSQSRISVATSGSDPIESERPTAMDVVGDPPMILLGRANGVLEFWNPRTRDLSASWQATSEIIRWIISSPDGKLVAVLTDSSIEIWDLENRTMDQQLEGSSKTHWTGAFSPDGALFASGGNDRKVIVWQVETGKRVQELQFDQPDSVRSVAFSPNGILLAAGSSDTNVVEFWETNSWKSQGEFEGHIQGISSIEFSPDSRTFATSSIDRTVTLWHLETQQELLTLSFEGPVRKVEFTSDGRFMIVGSIDLDGPVIRVWELSSGEEIASRPAKQETSAWEK